MIEKVLNRKNLYKAYRQVVQNKGSAGMDRMPVTELFSYLENNRDSILISILNHTYVPKPIKGVEIPKSNGKTRLLGVPTVVDRWLQQAVSQVLMTKYELTFEEHSYGFRPEKNIHKAVTQALKNINDGYQDIVDIDLKGFFDEVDHSTLLQLIYQRVKCPTTLRLLRKWLRAPIQINGKLHRRRKGVPQGSPISPLLSNILLDLLDKELERRNLKYVRYADDFSIYTKSKKEARKVGNEIYLFLKDKLRLPINKEKSGIRRPSNFEMLGHAFVPTYQKGVKGKYQLVVKKNSWESLKRKLKQITKKIKPYGFEERLKKLAEVWRGWVNNYRLASITAKLKSLDEWLRNRLRYCIWSAAADQSPILNTTITLSRLRRKGYESMLSYYLKTQPTIQ
jgi:group II intron reverse transcriptase/maturase